MEEEEEEEEEEDEDEDSVDSSSTSKVAPLINAAIVECDAALDFIGDSVECQQTISTFNFLQNY